MTVMQWWCPLLAWSGALKVDGGCMYGLCMWLWMACVRSRVLCSGVGRWRCRLFCYAVSACRVIACVVVSLAFVL